jgi:hypothetical protein
MNHYKKGNAEIVTYSYEMNGNRINSCTIGSGR